MRPLFSFEQESDLAAATANHTRLRLTARGATHGARALQVEYLPDRDWPNLMFRAPSPWDWRGYAGLAFDLYNPMGEPIQFGVRVDDDPRADGTNHCRQGAYTIPPRARLRCVFPLGRNPMDYGMRGLPPLGKDLTRIGVVNQGNLRLEHIVAFQIFLWRGDKTRTLIVDNIRLLEGDESLQGIVDEFGQYARADWQGKIRSMSHLRRTRTLELRELERLPAPDDFDEYGAWKTGPQLKATGYFRTEKVGDRWWLVAPQRQALFLHRFQLRQLRRRDLHHGARVYVPLAAARGRAARQTLRTRCRADGTHQRGQVLQLLRGELGTPIRRGLPSPMARADAQTPALVGVQHHRQLVAVGVASQRAHPVCGDGGRVGRA
jgi:hypothetical protein